ncbi:MAG: HipA domain-containing protein [Bacteroidales bacterium]|nr:HipA domain-containing protein [Bacteroidales bacterium]MBS3776683.1 HipA domain-containing protein [Bacteroidales bacterium]
MKKQCLFCYKENKESEDDFHRSCSRKIFGSARPPIFEYGLDEMNDLAKQVVERSVTVPGVQAKISLHLNRERSKPARLTLVGLWGEYILKPPAEKYAELPENEDLTIHLAEVFSIPVVPHTLIRLKSGELAYLSRRIDRDKVGKLHMEDMCQLTERLTEDKYKGSMEQVGKAIDKYSSNPLLDMVTFFEISLFSFLTGNADMHLKNFSLIDRRDGLTSLTPAYDLLSTRLVIPEKDDPEEMALMLKGKKRKFKLDHFIDFGATLGLTRKQISNTFDKFKRKIPNALDFIDWSFISDNKKEEYKELLISRAERLKMKPAY